MLKRILGEYGIDVVFRLVVSLNFFVGEEVGIYAIRLGFDAIRNSKIISYRKHIYDIYFLNIIRYQSSSMMHATATVTMQSLRQRSLGSYTAYGNTLRCTVLRESASAVFGATSVHRLPSHDFEQA